MASFIERHLHKEHKRNGAVAFGKSLRRKEGQRIGGGEGTENERSRCLAGMQLVRSQDDGSFLGAGLIILPAERTQPVSASLIGYCAPLVHWPYSPARWSCQGGCAAWPVIGRCAMPVVRDWTLLHAYGCDWSLRHASASSPPARGTDCRSEWLGLQQAALYIPPYLLCPDLCR